MRIDLHVTAAAQGGVFTRQQAMAAGHTPRDIRTSTREGGEWVTVRRGVYAERAAWEGRDDDGRYTVKVRAAAVAGVRPAVLSHASAAAVLGFELRPHWRGLVHVTRPGVLGSRTAYGVKHHRAAFSPSEVVEAEGLQVFGPARTAVDVARELTLEDGVVAADQALRRGATTRADLAAVAAGMAGWPHVNRVRAVLEAADAGAANCGETLLRLLVVELGLGVPETQFHVVEGRREDWLRGRDGGFGMSRVTWPELHGARREETKRRLAREVLQSHRLFGHLHQAA